MNKAFTLIELLIVVAIIAILAAIAVPNFLEAQVRAKVSRAKADLRTLATGVESYRVDYNQYPYHRATPPAYAPPFNENILDPADPASGKGLKCVTTPTSYLSSIPPDVFNLPARRLIGTAPGISDAFIYFDAVQTEWFLTVMRGGTIQAGATGSGRWMAFSVGPDQYLGVNWAAPTGGPLASIPGLYPSERISTLTPFTIRSIYDPTNGTVSAGNIIRGASQVSQIELLQ